MKKILAIGLMIGLIFVGVRGPNEASAESPPLGIRQAKEQILQLFPYQYNNRHIQGLRVSSDKDQTLSTQAGDPPTYNVQGVYNSDDGTFTYTDPVTGDTIVLDVSDIAGLSTDWLDHLGLSTGDEVTITIVIDGEDTEVLIVTKMFDENTKEWAYDTGSHLVTHYHTTGDLAGLADYVEQENGGTYDEFETGSDNPNLNQSAEYFVSQRFFYDADGELTKIEYYTFTGGLRNPGNDGGVVGRYTYRVDTYEDGVRTETTWYDDPRPNDWDPTLTGTVVQDEYGRYFLNVEGVYYLILIEDESQLNGEDLADLVGEEITLVGDLNPQNEGIYYDGNQAKVLRVVDHGAAAATGNGGNGSNSSISSGFRGGFPPIQPISIFNPTGLVPTNLAFNLNQPGWYSVPSLGGPNGMPALHYFDGGNAFRVDLNLTQPGWYKVTIPNLDEIGAPQPSAFYYDGSQITNGENSIIVHHIL